MNGTQDAEGWEGPDSPWAPRFSRPRFLCMPLNEALQVRGRIRQPARLQGEPEKCWPFVLVLPLLAQGLKTTPAHVEGCFCVGMAEWPASHPAPQPQLWPQRQMSLSHSTRLFHTIASASLEELPLANQIHPRRGE